MTINVNSPFGSVLSFAVVIYQIPRAFIGQDQSDAHVK